MRFVIGLATSLAALLLPVSSAFAVTRTVRPDGTGDFPTIKGAIHASAAGDTVLLIDGVFTGTGNRDVSLEVRPSR